MAKFEAKDFHKMTYNPFADMSGKRIWDFYPDLKIDVFLIPEFHPSDEEYYKNWSERNTEDLLKFVIMFVDPESPVLVFEKDYDKRKELVFEIMGLIKKNRVREEIQAETIYYNNILTGYFLLINNDQYQEWFSLRMNYTQALAVIRLPLGIDMNPADFQNKKTALVKSLGEIRDPMLKLEAQLFKDTRLQKKLLSGKIDELAGYAEKYAMDLPFNERT